MANSGSAQVAANLSAPLNETSLTERPIRDGDGLQGHTSAPGGAEHVVDPTGWGLNATGWVAVAAIIVLVIFLWKKVPAAIGRMLDTRIAAIRTQLDEASKLRAEAETLRAEYETRAKTAQAEAATMREHAHQEAHQILVKAKADAEALMARRAKMAEDKIAAAERAAIAEVRARAADTAAKAAGLLIQQQHGADADRNLVDRSIAGLGRPN
jgi:F-type H+-transporting ATPase subunit b